VGGFGIMLALIPARGGSKGIPRKNIRMLGGKPLISYAITAALNAKNIDRVIVTTEDKEIANIASSNGAEIPFLRPKELAQDDSKAIDAYIYTVEKLNEELDEKISSFIVILPTNPFVISEDIDNAIQLFKNKNADSVMSYTDASHPPLWAKKISEDLKVSNYFDLKDQLLNRQDIPHAYMPNGSIFIFRLSLLKSNRYLSDNSYGYIMPRERSIDIDTYLDFEYAEFLMKNQIKK
jgi:CMP-N,N'-diacetyllegionaminic acid synthase